ncbi:hypothetical protein MHU86_5952 [Fragilaria crotonensis]|nr:hypothetical protein MHU86_5952 [Fragilaria crotonensis]
MKIKQEYIPDVVNTHHSTPARSHQPQTGLFDESDVDDDDYSVRSDDDRKIPAPTRPKSTRKRQFDDSDVPACSPDVPPAKRMRFQTQKQPEIRYKTRQYVLESGTHQINYVGPAMTRTTKKVRNSSGAPRPAKQAATYQNWSDQSGDIAAQSDPMADPQFPISDHDHDRGDSHHQLPRVLDLGHIGPPRRTAIVQISFSTAAATFGSPSVHIFPHNANVILRPTGFEILPTPLRPRAPTPTSEMTDASDDVPARSTTNIYRDDDMDDDDDDDNDSDVVNASSVVSIYCPCPNQLCLSVRNQTLPTKAQKAPADVEVEEQSNGDKKESQKQLGAPPMNQNSTCSVPDSSDNDDSTGTSSFIPDSFTVKTMDSLTLMDRMTTRKATKNIIMTKNIPRPARLLPPAKSSQQPRQFATPINVANPFYVKPPINAAIPFTISIDDDETETPSTPSSRHKTQPCQINDLKTFNTSGPRNLDAPPSPAVSLNSELFSPLFSNLSSSHDSTFDCLSTTTGITAFLELSDDDETLELPYHLDKLHIPSPEDNILDPIHHIPFLQHHSDLDSRTNPHASLLFYADATLQDDINGPITMCNLPTCVDSSITAASFCLCYIQSNPATKQCICDLTTEHLRLLMCNLYPILIAGSDKDPNQEEFIQFIQHTFNRTTNLVMDNLSSEHRSQLTNGIPSLFVSLLSDYEPGSFGHECSLSILYAFKMMYLIHLYIQGQTSSCPHQPPELADIICNIPTFATARRLFPNRSNFRDVPRFIIKFFQDQQLTPSPYDTTLDSTRTCHIQTPAHLDSAYLIAFTHSPLVNGFGEHTTGISPPASHVARVLISATLRQHAILTAKLTIGDDLHLQLSNICIGSLPPADLLMNHNCSAFPMATLPTPEQLSTMDSKATAIAVNFVICHPLTSNDLQNFTIPTGNCDYATLKSHFDPIKTDVINHSIDFLPDHEYTMFRVVSNINITDPQCVLPQTPLPTKVLIYQGNTQEHQSTPFYTSGSPTEFPIPLPSAHTFPIIYNKENKPIIFHQHNRTIKPYTTTTVQQLFSDQASIPMNTCYATNPWTCPNNPSQLWRQPNPVYHVIDDPKTIPLSLATRLIQVITTKRGSTNVYGSWALPHLENALSNPLSQITHNPFSYYWQQHNHPEYPFIKESEPNILSNLPGESGVNTSLLNNQVTTCNLPDPSCLYRHIGVIATRMDSSNCNVVRFQLDKQESSFCEHTARMVVRTRRSSLQEENPPEIEPETADPDTSDNSSETDISRHETPNIDTNQPSSDVQAQEIDTPAENPLKCLSRTVTQILSPKSVQSDTQVETSSPKTPKPSKPAAKDKQSEPAKHPTFAYPPIHETFFTDDEDNEDQQDDPPQIPLQSPDALTSSTRTDFTYPPIEDLTKTLLKYAKNANLRKLSYPTDLVARRQQFNAFMDNLRIVCNISPWTRQVFDLWPKQISYSHPFIGTAIYNLIITHVCDPCQKHIIDGPPDTRTAIFALRQHCAPLTPDHVERTREAFYSIKQGHNEVATSYLNRIRVLTRDCYHAGIPNTDAELIKRAIRGGSNHHFMLPHTNALMLTSAEPNLTMKNCPLSPNLKAIF